MPSFANEIMLRGQTGFLFVCFCFVLFCFVFCLFVCLLGCLFVCLFVCCNHPLVQAGIHLSDSFVLFLAMLCTPFNLVS